MLLPKGLTSWDRGDLLALIARFWEHVVSLHDHVERLTDVRTLRKEIASLERAGKRQAAPFSKGRRARPQENLISVVVPSLKATHRWSIGNYRQNLQAGASATRREKVIKPTPRGSTTGATDATVAQEIPPNWDGGAPSCYPRWLPRLSA